MTKYTVNIKQSPDGVMTFDCIIIQERSDDEPFPVYEQARDLTQLLKSHFDVKHQKYILGIKEGGK